MSKKRVICLVGASGCGKSTLATKLSHDLRMPLIEVGQVVREVFKTNEGRSYESLIEFADDKLRTSKGIYFVARMAEYSQFSQDEITLIVGIRTMNELLYLLEHFDVLSVIYLKAGTIRRIVRKLRASSESLLYVLRRELIERKWGQYQMFRRAFVQVDASASPDIVFHQVCNQIAEHRAKQ